MRNGIQMEKVGKNVILAFHLQKVEEKYADQGIKSCDLREFCLSEKIMAP